MLSGEERGGITSVKMGGEAFQGSRNSLCEGRGLTESMASKSHDLVQPSER